MDVDYSRVQAEETFSINVELVEKFFTACTDEDTLDVDQNSLLLSQFTDFYHTVYQQAQTTNDDQQRKNLNKEDILPKSQLPSHHTILRPFFIGNARKCAFVSLQIQIQKFKGPPSLK